MSDTSITDALYPKVQKALSNPDNLLKYKKDLDRYMAANTDKYFICGPGMRPVFTDTHKQSYLDNIGLTSADVKKAIKDSKHIGTNWNIMNDPFNTANALATRYFAEKKNKEYIKWSQWYLLIALYPSLHYKYFKYNTNEACMAYTINNMSDKFKIRQLKSLWATLCDLIEIAYNLHEERILTGKDIAYVKYVQDVHTRINSLLKNIADKYYENYEQQKFVETEFESFEEDNYHEANSTSYDIDRLTNNCLTQLILHGSDMKLVEIAAKTSQVSVNELRTCMSKIINDTHKDGIKTVIENILFLFLFNTDGEPHSTRDVGTNTFMIYCLQVYKRSNTTNKNVVAIKSTIDGWLIETGIVSKKSRTATVLCFKKAFFTFFVMSIQKYAL